MENKCSLVRANKDVCGKDVKNNADEDLGNIKDIMLDKVSGRVAYVVLESGSFLGLGGKYFAVPWNMFHYDEGEECFRANINAERLKNAPGFDKDNWPDMTNRSWGQSIHTYYGSKPYWE